MPMGVTSNWCHPQGHHARRPPTTVPVLASRDRDLCNVRTHPIWSEPVAGYMSWLMALNLHNGLLPMGQCHSQGTPLLTGQLFHFPQCHSGLVSSRNEHVCLYHSIATGGSWCSRWEGVSSPSIACKHDIESEKTTTSCRTGSMCW